MKDFWEQETELKDRDLIIFRFIDNNGGYCNNEIISSEDVKRAYRDFQIDKDQFNILLIGKDGGIKMHQKQYVQTHTIFVLIDQMPMRQNEMQKK